MSVAAHKAVYLIYQWTPELDDRGGVTVRESCGVLSTNKSDFLPQRTKQSRLTKEKGKKKSEFAKTQVCWLGQTESNQASGHLGLTANK